MQNKRRRFFEVRREGAKSDTAFEVVAREIATYDVPARRLLEDLFLPEVFNFVSSFPITPKTEIKIHVYNDEEKGESLMEAIGKIESGDQIEPGDQNAAGEGWCFVETEGKHIAYHIDTDVLAFAREIHAARAKLPPETKQAAEAKPGLS